MNGEVLFSKVACCVAQVLAIEASDVTAESRLMEDLGADSLDLVELLYLLEQEFGVRMTAKEMSLSGQLGFAEEETHSNEVLTPKALELLRARYPQAQRLLVEGVTRRQLAGLLTVGEVAAAVERKMTADGGGAE